MIILALSSVSTIQGRQKDSTDCRRLKLVKRIW